MLQSASFGERIAEKEIKELSAYFVETDQWRRLFAGDVDIVYGPKGSGKSALYSLLTEKADELFDRGILIVPAENPSGATAFADVVTEPPTSETEFIGLWKLYFLVLLAQVLQDYAVETSRRRTCGHLLQVVRRRDRARPRIGGRKPKSTPGPRGPPRAYWAPPRLKFANCPRTERQPAPRCREPAEAGSHVRRCAGPTLLRRRRHR